MQNKDFMRRIYRELIRNWAAICALLAGIHGAWVTLHYLEQPILETEAFRQTLTALTSYWMVREGWQLAYETPSAGYPWAIPFEFPIYQSIVAGVAWLGDFPLEPVGRLVSFCFLLACAWPAFAIVRRLKLPSEVAWVFCALLWSSPLYLFWSRTFLVETAAVFFILLAIPFALDIRNSCPQWRSTLLFVLFATLAILQKSTTAAPVLLVLAAIMLASHFKNIKQLNWRPLTIVGFAFSVPLIVGVLWTHYADILKMQNVVGQAWTSRKMLPIYVGAIADRLSIVELKSLFWDKIFKPNAAGFLGVFVLASAVIFSEKYAKLIIITSIILFVLPILVFFRQHYTWDYYPVSCVVFLIAALAVSTVLGWQRGFERQYMAPLIVTILIISNILSFWTGYGKIAEKSIFKTRSQPLLIADVIRRYTPADSGIVVYASNWSSDIAFYSQRKSLSIEPWLEARIGLNPGAFLGGKDIGAIVFCGKNINEYRYRQIVEKYGAEVKQYGLFPIARCHLWLPQTKPIVLSDGTLVRPEVRPEVIVP